MKISSILLALIFMTLAPNSQNNLILNDTGNMSFELIKEKIIIPVQIGSNTYKFLLDTGGIFEISEKLQNEFNFNQLESTTIVDINRKEIEMQTVKVPEISLGNWKFKDRKAIVSNLHSKYPYSCFELDGMIGRDFFNQVLLHFDYANNTFRLTENFNAIALDKSSRTKMKFSRRGLPDIKVKINSKKEYIEFDSGSGDFYSPKTSDVERKLVNACENEILKFQGEFSFGVTMDNIEPTNRYIQKVENFQLANVNFINFYSQFSKVSAARIGAAILKYGKVTLDYKNRWFYYMPYSKSQMITSFETFGFDVAIENGYYKVKYILKNSKADELGLHSGNRILMIDDISTQNISENCEGYLNGYDFKDKQIIKVTFLDKQENEKSIVLNKIKYR